MGYSGRGQSLDDFHRNLTDSCGSAALPYDQWWHVFKHVLHNSALLTDLSPIVRHLLEETTALIYVLEEVPGRTEELVRDLRGRGFIVIPHSSPQALTRAIEQQEPRMLILDITRGVERLCQQFKTDPSTAQCPIVLTAEGSVASSREAHSVGADYYLTKVQDTVMLAAMLLSK